MINNKVDIIVHVKYNTIKILRHLKLEEYNGF